jgi:hypothetical protein
MPFFALIGTRAYRINPFLQVQDLLYYAQLNLAAYADSVDRMDEQSDHIVANLLHLRILNSHLFKNPSLQVQDLLYYAQLNLAACADSVDRMDEQSRRIIAIFCTYSNPCLQAKTPLYRSKICYTTPSSTWRHMRTAWTEWTSGRTASWRTTCSISWATRMTGGRPRTSSTSTTRRRTSRSCSGGSTWRPSRTSGCSCARSGRSTTTGTGDVETVLFFFFSIFKLLFYDFFVSGLKQGLFARALVFSADGVVLASKHNTWVLGRGKRKKDNNG